MAATGPYMLAAMDMDGTLLNTDHRFTPYTVRALEKAARAGKALAFCTGRCLSELWAHFEAVPAIGYAIGENGGCLYDVKAKKVLYQLAMKRETAVAMLDLAMEYDVIPQCFMSGQSYMQLRRMEDLAPHHVADYEAVFRAGTIFVDDVISMARGRDDVEKINIYFARAEDKADFNRRSKDLDLFIADSLGYGYEASPREATKSAGLARLCEHLGIPIGQSLAIGDGGNDVDLMRAAGLSVAMGNATEAVKAAADAVTEDCDHDGAAKAVLRYMLGEDV